MRFIYGAPGFLLPDGSGGFIAKWTVADDNVDYSQGAVEAQVSEALNDSRGWGQLGITFEQVAFPPTDSHAVVFKTVASTTVVGSPEWSWAVTVWPNTFGAGNPPNTQILLEAAHFEDLGIPNHEAAHAYFGATHSPEGSDSLMEPMEDPGSEWPSPTDLAQVGAWLGTASEDNANHDNPRNETAGSAAVWFPGDLPYYVTRFSIPEGSQARLTATVLEGARVALQPVYHTDYAELMAGNGKRFGAGLDCYRKGFFYSPWRDTPASGDLYVGIEAHTDNAVDVNDLIIGLAEVQTRSTV